VRRKWSNECPAAAFVPARVAVLNVVANKVFVFESVSKKAPDVPFEAASDFAANIKMKFGSKYRSNLDPIKHPILLALDAKLLLDDLSM
jgi:hypothetical protein